MIDEIDLPSRYPQERKKRNRAGLWPHVRWPQARKRVFEETKNKNSQQLLVSRKMPENSAEWGAFFIPELQLVVLSP